MIQIIILQLDFQPFDTISDFASIIINSFKRPGGIYSEGKKESLRECVKSSITRAQQKKPVSYSPTGCYYFKVACTGIRPLFKRLVVCTLQDQILYANRRALIVPWNSSVVNKQKIARELDLSRFGSSSTISWCAGNRTSF
jgi:hypothetical protein